MTKLTVWDPFRDMENLHSEINKLFAGTSRGNRDAGMASWTPNVDIYEDAETVRIHTELPGMKKEDVKLSVEDGVLTIKGERKFEHENRKGNYHRIERSYGMFERAFTLPTTVEPERIEASMKDGILEIVIPKREEVKPKEIEIKVK